MPTPLAPSRARHWVVVFAVTLAVLSYIDRVAISKAAPYIMQDLGLTKTEMGRVFSAFALAYALAEIPSGWMGDTYGPRKVLMRIVVWWSFFTASVTVMWNGLALMINQLLFGAGEAGCFPNLTKMFTTWLPSRERVRAQGIMWMAARWGGAFTPILVAPVFTRAALARGVSDLRVPGRDLGRLLLPLVPGRPQGPPGGQRGRT
ncbi:MAG: MFS transporter [Microthrixaceae bacterium]